MNNDLTNVLLRLEKADYSLCNIDTLIRINNSQEDWCTCTRCVFKDTKGLPYLGCPHEWAHILRQSERK